MTAADVLAHALAGPARLGGTRLICIDGRSGSGKTTLAGEVGALADAAVVPTDALCPGWDGLPQVPALLARLLAPLAEGLPGSAPTWDWEQDRPGEDLVVVPAPVLVLEGVGAGAVALAPWTTTLVWVEADADRRRQRALLREPYFAATWDAWADAEDAYLAGARLPARADLVVDR